MHDPGVPLRLPQARDLDKLRRLLKLFAAGVSDLDDVGTAMGAGMTHARRHASYYREAAEILGMVEPGTSTLSGRGVALLDARREGEGERAVLRTAIAAAEALSPADLAIVDDEHRPIAIVVVLARDVDANETAQDPSLSRSFPAYLEYREDPAREWPLSKFIILLAVLKGRLPSAQKKLLADSVLTKLTDPVSSPDLRRWRQRFRHERCRDRDASRSGPTRCGPRSNGHRSSALALARASTRPHLKRWLRRRSDPRILDLRRFVAGDAGRGQTIAGTLRIVAALLQGRELTAKDVVEILGSQPAAANRQLKVFERELADVGFRSRATAQGRMYSLPSTHEQGARPTVPMAIAACFASSLAPLFEQTQFGVAMRAATKQIVDRAKRTVSSKDIDRKFFFHVRGGEIALPDNAPTLSKVVTALLDCRWLRLTYTDFEGRVHEKLDVRPLSVVVHEHQLYVVGANQQRPLHPYRFARIASAELLEKQFEYPARSAYDPKQAFSNSIGVFLDPEFPVVDVVVRLSPRWRTYANSHRWHHSQSVDEDEHGVVVRLHVRHCRELEQWILAFAEEAEVLAPESLRAKIAERAAAMAAKYRNS